MGFPPRESPGEIPWGDPLGGSPGGVPLGVKINRDKLEWMCVGKNQNGVLFQGGKKVDRVSQMEVLGTIVTSNLDPGPQLHDRIAAAWRAFWSERMTLLDKNLPICGRLNFLKVIVQPVLTYGVEVQQLTMQDLKRLDSAYVDMASRVIAPRRMPQQPWLEWRIAALRLAKEK